MHIFSLSVDNIFCMLGLLACERRYYRENLNYNETKAHMIFCLQFYSVYISLVKISPLRAPMCLY